MEHGGELADRERARADGRRAGLADQFRRAVHTVGQGQLPERRVPTRRARRWSPVSRRSRSSCPPIPGSSGEVDPAVLVVCRKLGISDVFRVNGPAGIAALGFGTESIPRVRKIVGPGSPAVTLAQVEMQRHGTATMMLLGPTESIVIADDTADADPDRGRPPDRGRARHRHLGRPDHDVGAPRRRRRRRTRAATRRPPRRPLDRRPRRPRPERRLHPRRRPRRSGRRRQRVRTRAPPGRRRRRRGRPARRLARQRRRDPHRPAHAVLGRQLRHRLPGLAADQRVRPRLVRHHRATRS